MENQREHFYAPFAGGQTHFTARARWISNLEVAGRSTSLPCLWQPHYRTANRSREWHWNHATALSERELFLQRDGLGFAKHGRHERTGAGVVGGSFAPEFSMSDGHTLTGNIQHHAEFSSRILDNQRDIWVYLPPGYRRATRQRYPVFYLHDGQNVFDAATAFGGIEWNADETAQGLIKKGLVEPLIIVAIGSVGENRIHEYTPTAASVEPNAESETKSLGLLRDYGRFLVEELKPFIDQTYRTRPDKDSTGLGGSSLGGLASLILSFWFPETFSRIAALSPSIWWDNCVIYRIIDELEDAPRSSKIWLDTGTHEEGWERARQLRDHLVEKGWRLHDDLHYKEVQGAQHAEWAWSARFEAVLRFLFPPLPRADKNSRKKPIVVLRAIPENEVRMAI